MVDKTLTFVGGIIPSDIAQMLLDRGYTVVCKPQDTHSENDYEVTLRTLRRFLADVCTAWTVEPDFEEWCSQQSRNT